MSRLRIRRKSELGSTVVESAIVSGVALMLILGSLQMITVALFHTKLEAVAAMGARIASAELTGLGPQQLAVPPAANVLKIGQNGYLDGWRSSVNPASTFSPTDLYLFDYLLGYTLEIFAKRSTPQLGSGWTAHPNNPNNQSSTDVLIPVLFPSSEVSVVPGAMGFDGSSRVLSFPSTGTSVLLSDSEEPRAVYACAESPLNGRIFRSGIICTGYSGFHSGI